MRLAEGEEKPGDFFLSREETDMKIGDRVFDVEHETYIMGILNVTPDSFSDGGRWNDRDKALKHALEMTREGAAVLDIGGESTRPGHQKISEEEEIARTAPVIEASFSVQMAWSRAASVSTGVGSKENPMALLLMQLSSERQ